MKAIRIEIEYDDQAKVFLVASSSVLGLSLEAETLKDLLIEISEAMPFLIEANHPGEMP